jgi:hypothetical protein
MEKFWIMSQGPASRVGLRISLLLLVAGILWTTGCSKGTEGIFYSLEQEEKAVDNTLPNDVRITGNMIKVTIGSESRYYLGAGSLFYRTTDLADKEPWTKIKSPISYGIVSGVAEVGGRVYVSLSDGSEHGLFRLKTSGTDYETNNLYSDKQITRLFTLNNTLFASVGTILDDTFALMFWNGSSLVPTGVSGYKIVAGAWDGVNYWFASPSDLFRFNAAPSLNGWTPTPYYSFLDSQSGTSPPPPDVLNNKTYFTDLFVDDTDPSVSSPPYSLYLCSSDGYVFKTKDGGVSWRSSVDHNRSFQSISKVGNIIVLGAGGSVVRELPNAVDKDDLETLQTPGGNFLRLPDLYGSNVIRVFGFGNILYAGTTANGLWRGDYSTDPSSPVWSQE